MAGGTLKEDSKFGPFLLFWRVGEEATWKILVVSFVLGGWGGSEPLVFWK